MNALLIMNKYILSCLLTLGIVNLLFADTVELDSLFPGDYQYPEYTVDQLHTLENLSAGFMGLPKIDRVSAKSPDGHLSEWDRWPQGAWGRGYQTHAGVVFYPKNVYGYYWAAHPLMRDVSLFLRGHIQLAQSGAGSDSTQQYIAWGIDYILSEQVLKGNDRGGFIFWKQRARKNSMRMNPPVNKVHAYETACALAALNEYYLAGYLYHRSEVLLAIQRAEDNLVRMKDKDDQIDNSNMKGLVLWALSGAYKITGNNAALKKIKSLSEILLNDQTLEADSLSSHWETGGSEGDDALALYHDTKIYYHFLILRGLAESAVVVRAADPHLALEITHTVKRGINHVLRHRIDLRDPSNYKLRYGYLTTKNEPLPDWFVYDASAIDIVMETLSKITWYAQTNPNYSESEKSILLKLSLKIAAGLNPDEKWHLCSIGYYLNFIECMSPCE